MDEPWTVDGFHIRIGAGLPYVLGGVRLLKKEFPDITDHDIADLKAGKVVERRDPWDTRIVITFLGTWTEGQEPEDVETGPFMGKEG